MRNEARQSDPNRNVDTVRKNKVSSPPSSLKCGLLRTPVKFKVYQHVARFRSQQKPSRVGKEREVGVEAEVNRMRERNGGKEKGGKEQRKKPRKNDRKRREEETHTKAQTNPPSSHS